MRYILAVLLLVLVSVTTSHAAPSRLREAVRLDAAGHPVCIAEGILVQPDAGDLEPPDVADDQDDDDDAPPMQGAVPPQEAAPGESRQEQLERPEARQDNVERGDARQDDLEQPDGPGQKY